MGAAALGAAQFLLRGDMDTRGRAPVESGQPRCFVAAESVAPPLTGSPHEGAGYDPALGGGGWIPHEKPLTMKNHRTAGSAHIGLGEIPNT